MGIFNRKSENSTKEIPAVCNVHLERYLGTWYEIARFPHSFEKGLENVTATYNLKSDGKIEVINAGFKNGKKSVAKATAWIPDESCNGKLLVSFFRPIKSEYKIIKLDKENYSFAVITSSTKNYLWILSREPKISEELYNDLISFVSSKGFDTSNIIEVNQNVN
jgi:apolipoprotein D and lipocalin family protein